MYTKQQRGPEVALGTTLANPILFPELAEWSAIFRTQIGTALVEDGTVQRGRLAVAVVMFTVDMTKTAPGLGN